MIRGPILPQTRDSLWSLMASRLDAIETGLTLVLEGLDCSDGELGVVDGLARDAQGGPVLILLAMDGDALLPARALSAGQFLQRAGDGLVQAVPEARFCSGIASRVLVVGGESAATSIAHVCELSIAGLHACVLAPFRIAGQERFAVRWLATPAAAAGQLAGIAGTQAAPSGGAAAATVDSHSSVPLRECDRSHPEFVIPPARAELWQLLSALIERIDIGVSVQGDRFLRRITWNGSLLGDVRTVGDSLVMRAVTGFVSDLCSERDARRFVDQLLRAFVRQAGIDLADLDVANVDGANTDQASEKVTLDDSVSAPTPIENPHVPTPPVGGQVGRGVLRLDRSGLSANGLSANGLPANGSSANGRVPLDASTGAVVPQALAGNGRLPAPRHAESRQVVEAHQASEERSAAPCGESLRSSLAAAKLTPEEYSALGGPPSGADPNAEGPVARDRS